MTTSPRRVTSTDGVTLAVYESGAPGAPAVVAVHGYPDNHAVWDGVTAILAERFRVVAYDVRGSGASDRPAGRAGYRMAQLVDDFHRVVDAVSPDAPVHALAHDWGSIQCWAAVADPRASGRVASLTSISGPALDHAGAWLRDLRAHPRAALRQLAHSYYVALFQLPALPELAARRGIIDRAARGRAPGRTADALNGLSLYRANLIGGFGRPRPRPRPVPIPVQLIVAEHDAFVTPDLAIGSARPWVADLTVRRVAAGHWVISEQPGLVARLTGEFVDEAIRV